MESVDPKKMQVLLLVDTKKGQKWLDYTQKAISAQPYGNGIHIVFSSGDERTFGHARATLQAGDAPKNWRVGLGIR